MSEIQVIVSDDPIILEILDEPLPVPVEVGIPGPQGIQGPAATVAVGTVETLPAGSPADVQNVGTSGAAILAFKLPRGDKGETGDPFSNIDGGNAASVYGGIEPIDGGGA